jgi:hypothetical protein
MRRKYQITRTVCNGTAALRHASPTLHPAYRRLLKLTFEELRLTVYCGNSKGRGMARGNHAAR